jgi:MYXO-CTERM domain-containing protein
MTASVPAGYDPTSEGCFGAQGGPGLFFLYWKNQCVGFSVQQDASPLRGITLAQARAVAGVAFAQWSGVACPAGGHPSVQAEDEGPVACDKVEYNSNAPNQHVIVFRDTGWPYADSSNTLGLTTVTYDTTDGEIYDADMELNSHDYDLVLTSPAPVGAYDLASVITHEAGHFLGLAHSPDITAVMYAHYQPGASTPTPDDVAGICTIYPSDGTRSTSAGPVAAASCDPTARHGFSTQCGSELDAGAGGTGETSGQTTRKCSVGGAPGAGGGGAYGAVGLVAVALLARRMRRSARRTGATTRAIAAVAGIALSSVGAIALVARDAHASVSVAAFFDELVRQSSAVAAVTPVAQLTQWEDGRIITYTRMRVDAAVAGELPQEAWVRTLGGAVEKLGQIVEGEPSFVVGQPSLVFLRQRAGGAFEVTARAQGQFPIVSGDGKAPHLVSARDLGAILPPAAERVAKGTAPGGESGSLLASEVLHGRSLDGASREIALTWARFHAK